MPLDLTPLPDLDLQELPDEQQELTPTDFERISKEGQMREIGLRMSGGDRAETLSPEETTRLIESPTIPSDFVRRIIENKPEVMLARNLPLPREASEFVEGVKEAAADTIAGLTSPMSVAKLPAYAVPYVGPAVMAFEGGQAIAGGGEHFVEALNEGDPRAAGRAAAEISGGAAMLTPGLHVAAKMLPPSELALRSEIARGSELTPEQIADAQRRAVNLAAPGTVRPTEAIQFGAPEADKPQMFEAGEVPFERMQRFGGTQFPPPQILPSTGFLPPPEIFEETRPKQELETRGKVSFGAGAPELLRTATEEQAAIRAAEDVGLIKAAAEARKAADAETIRSNQRQPDTSGNTGEGGEADSGGNVQQKPSGPPNAPGSPAQPANAEAPEVSLSPVDQYVADVVAGKVNKTGQAFAFGKTVKTAEDIAKLRQAYKDVTEQARTALSSLGENPTPEKMQAASDLASKPQFFNEAIEAATGADEFKGHDADEYRRRMEAGKPASEPQPFTGKPGGKINNLPPKNYENMPAHERPFVPASDNKLGGVPLYDEMAENYRAWEKGEATPEQEKALREHVGELVAEREARHEQSFQGAKSRAINPTDISAKERDRLQTAYSADKFPKAKTVTVDDKLYTVSSVHHIGLRGAVVRAWRLIPESEYKGKPTPDAEDRSLRYEGKPVTVKGKPYRMTEPRDFVYDAKPVPLDTGISSGKAAGVKTEPPSGEISLDYEAPSGARKQLHIYSADFKDLPFDAKQQVQREYETTMRYPKEAKQFDQWDKIRQGKSKVTVIEHRFPDGRTEDLRLSLDTPEQEAASWVRRGDLHDVKMSPAAEALRDKLRVEAEKAEADKKAKAEAEAKERQAKEEERQNYRTEIAKEKLPTGKKTTIEVPATSKEGGQTKIKLEGTQIGDWFINKSDSGRYRVTHVKSGLSVAGDGFHSLEEARNFIRGLQHAEVRTDFVKNEDLSDAERKAILEVAKHFVVGEDVPRYFREKKSPQAIVEQVANFPGAEHIKTLYKEGASPSEIGLALVELTNGKGEDFIPNIHNNLRIAVGQSLAEHFKRMGEAGIYPGAEVDLNGKPVKLVRFEIREDRPAAPLQAVVESDAGQRVVDPQNLKAREVSAAQKEAPERRNVGKMSDEELRDELNTLRKEVAPLYAELDKIPEDQIFQKGTTKNTPEYEAIDSQIRPIAARIVEIEQRLKENEQRAQNEKNVKAREERIKNAPVYQRRNGWEIVREGAQYAVRDPISKEEIYIGSLKRSREVADESKPEAVTQAATAPEPSAEQQKAPGGATFSKVEEDRLAREYSGKEEAQLSEWARAAFRVKRAKTAFKDAGKWSELDARGRQRWQQARAELDAAVAAFDKIRNEPPPEGFTPMGAATPGSFPKQPGPIQEAYDRTARQLRSARATIGKLWAAGEIRDAMAATRDAADNKANIFSREMANEIRHEIGRQFPGKESLAEEALAVFVEAGRDDAALSANRDKIENSTAGSDKWRAKALAAHDFALYNQDKLRPIAERYSQITDAQIADEAASGVDTLKRDNYVMHAQDIEEPLSVFAGGGEGAGTSFRKVRTHETFADSIAAGVDPKTINAVDLLQSRLASGQRAINRRAWMEGLRGLNDPETGAPIATDVIPVKRADGSVYHEAPQGYSLEYMAGQPVAVQKGYEGIFRALTKPSALADSLGWRMLLNGNAAGKSVNLAFDTFHLGRLAAWESLIKSLGISTAKLPIPSFRKGVTLLDNTIPEIQKMAANGEISPKLLPDLIENKRRLNLLVETGYNVGRISDALYQDMIHHIPVIGKFNKFVFDQFQRGAMSEIGLLEFERAKRAMPGVDEIDIARRVSKDLNTRFGNFGRQGILKSRTGQDIARLLVLAPQWNEGLIRSELGAIKQAGELAVDVAKGRPIYAGVLLRSVGAMAVGQFIANQLINFYTRGHPTWENKEEGVGAKLSAWIPDKVGNGPGFFLHPLGLAAETTHLLMQKFERTQDFLLSLKEYARSRSSAAMRPLITFITREDALGRKIKPEDVGGEIAKSAVPVPIGSPAIAGAVKQVATGEPAEKFPGQFQKQMMATVGVKTDQTPSSGDRMAVMARDFNKTKGVEPDAEFYEGDYVPLQKALRIGNKSDAASALEELRKKKTVPQIREHFYRMAKRPFTGSSAREREFKRSLDEEQRRAYDEAIDERRRIAREALKLLHAPVTAAD